jgi:ABC-type nickel/cobalt efflux system permease component RcnA
MTKVNLSALIVAVIITFVALAVLALYLSEGGSGLSLSSILNPSSGLRLSTIVLIAFVLGVLHGVTPDEHTWPITFSYAVGSYSTRRGMKSGFAFSAGFTLQRAFLTTLGFLGLAAIYQAYNLDGPIYVIVGIVMAVAGAYILNKKIDLHLPFDVLLGSRHHSEKTERTPMHDVPIKMAVVHGLIAGFGFGAYATVITFILAPQVPGLIYAPLPGLFFGIGTMMMQVVFGAVFANIGKLRKLTEAQIKHIGRKTAGRTLYYGGMMFAIIGLLIVAFPVIDRWAISTGNPIPNLDSVGVATLLVLVVVGIFGLGNMILGFHELMKKKKRSDVRKY